MTAKVIDFQKYKEANAPEEKSEYRLLQEVMQTLFGPLEEPEFESEIKESDSADVSTL